MVIKIKKKVYANERTDEAFYYMDGQYCNTQ